ncbi:MAG: hypoxanthine phosphoribosyltransferase [Bacteriovoracaceae bacterium]|nr:hypoxanthine phosphoribosyltransferase [Bacteriovoracaceae bacterium]
MKKTSVFISEEQLDHRILEMAKKIDSDFAGEEITVLCILKGSFIFCADLVRKLKSPLKIEFITLSSYGDEQHSSGEIKGDLTRLESLTDKNVLVVEDIVDTGLTLSFLMKNIALKKPRKLKLMTLLYKPSKLRHPLDLHYVGFEIEDKFVVGYGLDFAQNYRELPYVGVMDS